MDRMIYTALAGMNAAMDRQRMVASNLANAQTAGFRAELFATTPLTLKGPALEARSLAHGVVRGADMSAGVINATGNPLDVALRGDALLALQGNDGAEVYSRRGDLRVSASGVLENGEGRPVMGEQGPITVPLGRAIGIGHDGSVTAADPAAPDAPAEVLGRIKLANPAGSRIVKDLDGFLRVPDGGVLPADPTARVQTGALEGSNVDTAAVLVDMIEAQRSFETRAKLFATAGEIDQAGSQLMSLRG